MNTQILFGLSQSEANAIVGPEYVDETGHLTDDGVDYLRELGY